MNPHREIEYKREWEVAYWTAIGRSCGAKQPTPAIDRIARAEADAHIQAVRKADENLEKVP